MQHIEEIIQANTNFHPASRTQKFTRMSICKYFDHSRRRYIDKTKKQFITLFFK